MKTLKHIFLLLFLISVITCCDKDNDKVITESKDIILSDNHNKDIILSDNHNNVFLKRKGHWGGTDNRIYQSTFSSDISESYSFKGSSLHLNFIKELKELNLYIKNINTQVIYEDTFSCEKDSSYSIPVTFFQGEEYVIEVTNGQEAYYLIFIIQ